jgi:hypothetical protein
MKGEHRVAFNKNRSRVDPAHLAVDVAASGPFIPVIDKPDI